MEGSRSGVRDMNFLVRKGEVRLVRNCLWMDLRETLGRRDRATHRYGNIGFDWRSWEHC